MALTNRLADNSNDLSSTSIANKRRINEDNYEGSPPKRMKTNLLSEDASNSTALSTELDIDNDDTSTAKPQKTLGLSASSAIDCDDVNRHRMLYSRPSTNRDGKVTLFFRTKDIFDSDTIRNPSRSDQTVLLVMKSMFPQEFLKWRGHYSNIPKRIKHMDFIPRFMLKTHPTEPLDHLLNSCCPRKVMGASLDGAELVNLAIPHHNVFLFAKNILEKVLPVELYGTKSNWQAFFDRVKQFIGLRKTETLRNRELVQNIHIKDCVWLAKNPKSTNPISPSDATKRSDLMIQVTHWIFNDYIVELLRTCFYITDHADHGGRLFYFRQDDWLDISKRWLTQTLQESFKQIDPDSIRSLKLGPSSTRLIPKKKSLRRITNMKNNYRTGGTLFSKYNGQLSTNVALKPVQAVLKFEMDRRSISGGSGLTTIASIVERISAYKSSVNRSCLKKTGFYFSKVDVARCFDTIDQDRLMNILQYTFVDEQYLIRTYRIKKKLDNKTVFNSKNVACSLDTSDELLEKISRNPDIYNVTSTRVSTKMLLELIEEHVKRNTISIGTKLYQQKKGIPQGSCISSILCEIFLGHLESLGLAGLKSVTNGILLRYVDDFLFISNVANDVRQFETMITKAMQDFGLQISGEKTTNNLKTISHIKEVSWCGLKVSAANLDISNDYSAFSWTGIKNGLTVTTIHYNQELLRKCVINIKRQLYWLRKTKNSCDGIYRVIYEAAVICAGKLFIYASELSKIIRQCVGDDLVLDAFYETIKTAVQSIPRHVRKKLTIGLMIFAFYKVTQSRRSNLHNVLATLKSTRKSFPIGKRLHDLSKNWYTL